MRVERYNYRAQFENIEALETELRQMLMNGRYVLSEEVKNFEQSFAEYLGARYVRGVNTGTDALIIALLTLGSCSGREVITQANTFHATAAAIKLAGGIPVLVDADENSYLMAESQLPASITPKTHAIIPVHLYGKPTPMMGILRIAEKSGVSIIEDAAQAHGARLKGNTAGTVGILGCFSFHPSKNLAAAGDGGAIATNSSVLAGSIDRLRALGQQGQNNHIALGYNSKLDALQARILQWKLPRLEQWNQSRRRVASCYRERLQDLPVTFQSVTPTEQHAYHLFAVRTDRRDELLTHLQFLGVDAVVRYPTPIHLQPSFADCGWQKGQFPVAEKLAKELLCLPIRPDMRIEEIDYVSDCVRSFFSVSKGKMGLTSLPIGS